MNFLAHAVLSFHDPEVLFGQMISDFVKGRKKFEYPLPVLDGIMLHRQIDTFTDEHPVTRDIKEIYRPLYRLYSGAFVDISYDHFLATDSIEFPGGSLHAFSQETYRQLETFNHLMPTAFAGMFPYMKRDNWLSGYSTTQGLFRSFRGLVHRSAYLTDSQPAAELFDKNYGSLKAAYQAFWPELKKFSASEFAKIRPANN